MSPKALIVDCGPFCAVGFLRTIDKSEFLHSLDPKRTFAPATIRAYSTASTLAHTEWSLPARAQ